MRIINRSFIVILIMTYLFLSHTIVQSKVLFYDDFDDGKIEISTSLKITLANGWRKVVLLPKPTQHLAITPIWSWQEILRNHTLV